MTEHADGCECHACGGYSALVRLKEGPVAEVEASAEDIECAFAVLVGSGTAVELASIVAAHRARATAELRAELKLWEARQAELQGSPRAIDPDADAPREVAALPDWWDARRAAQGKPDASRCAAELRVALAAGDGGGVT
jgi:hypothetical protein